MGHLGKQIWTSANTGELPSRFQIHKDKFTQARRKIENDLPHLSSDVICSSIHDLCQPLTCIQNNATAASFFMENNDHEGLKLAVEDIIASSRYASNIARELCKMLQNEAHVLNSVNVNDLIRESLDLIRNDLAIIDCDVSTTLQSNLPEVIGSRIQIQQILLNLFINGIEAMRESASRKKSIHVASAVVEDNTIQVSIRDTGPGISEQCYLRIFEPFFTTKPKGTGIGLWISQEMAHANGGNIEALNSSSGGAIFRLTFRSIPPNENQW